MQKSIDLAQEGDLFIAEDKGFDIEYEQDEPTASDSH